jgi:hypothetical protein
MAGFAGTALRTITIGGWRAWMPIAAAVFALAIKTAIALNTYGTNDVMTWERDLAKVEGEGAATLYREGILYKSAEGVTYASQPFIHPPFMLTVLRVWAALARASGRPLQFWLRFTSSLADLMSLLLVAGLLKRLPQWNTASFSLMAMALCPVSVVIAGFHGNTDPVMIAFVLLSTYCIASGRSMWAAGAAMGMALNIKIVPLIFIPAVLLYLPAMRERLRYIASLAAVFLLGSLPYLVQDPLLIAKTMLGYSSKSGLWGLSLLSILTRDMRWSGILRHYDAAGKVVVLGAILCLSAVMNSRGNKPPLFLQCGAIAFLFLLLTPGFGMQYLAWLVPWVLALGIGPTLFFYGVAGAFVLIVYNDWCGGFPWYLANVLTGGWGVRHALLGLLCWAAILAVLAMYFNRLFAPQTSAAETERMPRLPNVAAPALALRAIASSSK